MGCTLPHGVVTSREGSKPEAETAQPVPFTRARPDQREGRARRLRKRCTETMAEQIGDAIMCP